jgi:CelD/BcsL family acetyltransferase involved in cellulose biosynthesis
MIVRVSESANELAALGEAWHELADRCDALSLYSTYDYVRIAWKHFSTPRERLFVLSLYDGETLKAIAPFLITTRTLNRIPVRTIAFVAAWEGDRPSLVAPQCEPAAWDAVYSFLAARYRAWDVLDLVEQPRDSYQCTQVGFLKDRAFHCEQSHDSTNYYIDVSGSWDSYYGALSASVRKRHRKRTRQLEELPGGLSIETIVEPDRIAGALQRYADLERLGWKAAHGIGLHANGPLRRFTEEFTTWAAERGQAAIYFLRSGDKDIAAYVDYRHRDVVYARHTAYDPAFGKFAPGIHLKAEIVRSLFGAGLREFNELGMHPLEGPPMFKVEWASGTRETRQVLVVRKSPRTLPIVWARRIRGWIRRPAPAPPPEGS